MTNTNDTLDQILEQHINGEVVAVPESLTEAFEQAMAGDAALRQFLDETVIAGKNNLEQRNPPQLPVDYQIERELGQGGMGVVYLARQQSLNRDVAIKVLLLLIRRFAILLIDSFAKLSTWQGCGTHILWRSTR